MQTRHKTNSVRIASRIVNLYERMVIISIGMWPSTRRRNLLKYVGNTMQQNCVFFSEKGFQATVPETEPNISYPTELISQTRLSHEASYIQGGVTSAHAVGRSATAVKGLTGENFTLTLDLQRLSSLTYDLSVPC